MHMSLFRKDDAFDFDFCVDPCVEFPSAGNCSSRKFSSSSWVSLGVAGFGLSSLATAFVGGMVVVDGVVGFGAVVVGGVVGFGAVDCAFVGRFVVVFCMAKIYV